MNLAIVNQYGSSGGNRFLKALVLAMAKNYPDLNIAFFADTSSIKKDNLINVFKKFRNINVFPLNKAGKEFAIQGDIVTKSTLLRFKKFVKKWTPLAKIYNFLRFKVLGKEYDWCRFRLSKEIVGRLNNFDLIYLAWPYFFEPANFKLPIVATFHDFNFKYPFGNFSKKALRILDKQIIQWLKICKVAIVDTKFMVREMEKFYPGLAKNKKVICLSTFITIIPSEAKTNKILARFKIPRKYAIYPSNTSAHKNFKNLFKAFGILKEKKQNIPLILVGHGTNNINLFSKGEFPKSDIRYEYFKVLNETIDQSGLETGKDIYALGYVSDKEIDALIAKAELVVSPSFYEGSAGPPLDAWKLGVPVAFSDIPTFFRHLDFLKTKAWVFDPNKPEDIAQKINQALTQKEVSKKMVQESKEAIEKYTWDDVARQYYEVFEEAIRRRKN